MILSFFAQITSQPVSASTQGFLNYVQQGIDWGISVGSGILGLLMAFSLIGLIVGIGKR